MRKEGRKEGEREEVEGKEKEEEGEREERGKKEKRKSWGKGYSKQQAHHCRV